MRYQVTVSEDETFEVEADQFEYIGGAILFQRKIKGKEERMSKIASVRLSSTVRLIEDNENS